MDNALLILLIMKCDYRSFSPPLHYGYCRKTNGLCRKMIIKGNACRSKTECGYGVTMSSLAVSC